MRLDALLPEAPEALRALDVTGVTANSRTVAPGFLFFAVAGARADGLQFAAQALAAGAIAIVGERRRKAKVRAFRSFRSPTFAPPCRRPPRALPAPAGNDRRGHRHMRQDLGRRFHPPDIRLLGLAAASLGTIGVIKPSAAVYGSLTTPDPVTLHKTLDALAGEGVTHLAMEASSHGLDQRRLDGVGSRRALSPIFRATISTITPASRIISPPSCGCSMRCCGRDSRR